MIAQGLQFISPELLLTAVALVVGLGSVLFKDKRALDFLALVGVVFAIGLLPHSTRTSVTVFSNMLVNDGFSLFFKTVILGMAALVILMSMGYRSLDEDDRGEYYFFLLAMTVSMLLAVSSQNLVMIYLTLEGVSLMSYIMAGYLKRDSFSSEAGIKYFLFGALSTAITLYGISLIYGLFGTLDLALISHVIRPEIAQQPIFIIAALLVLAGFGFKCSLVPFHMWTPDVYEGAPTPVAAFFSVAPKAMGFAFILRVFVQCFGAGFLQWSTVGVAMAVVTMIVGNVVALSQNNMKRLLAYSTIAQAGYMLVGLAIPTPDGIKAVLFYIFIYGLMNLGAFAAVIAVSNGVKSEKIDDYAGLYQKDSFLAIVLAVCLLSLAGLPPLAGFLAKFFIIAAAVQAKFVAVAVILVVNSVIALYYYVRVVKVMFLTETKNPSSLPQSAGIRLALVVILCGNIAFGVWPHPILEWLSRIVF